MVTEAQQRAQPLLNPSARPGHFVRSARVRPPSADLSATQLATSDAESITPKPVTRGFVGRPGLDPGTLGLGNDLPKVSMVVRLSRSQGEDCPTTSSDVPLDLLLRLSDWLSTLGF